MLNFSNLKGLQQPSRRMSVPPHMSEALAMVREGRLQEASALLMGHRHNEPGVGAETTGTVASPKPRLSGQGNRT